MCTGELCKTCKINLKKFALDSILAIRGYDTAAGANDVIIVKQTDGSIKASPLEVSIKVTSEMRNAVSSTKIGIDSGIQVGDNNLIEFNTIQSIHLQNEDAELSFDFTNGKLQEMNLVDGINPSYFVIEMLNIRIPFSIYVLSQDEKLIISDIDGTITKSDTWGFFGGALGYEVHHKFVNTFLCHVYGNGYKTIYLTARSIRYQSFTKNYLFEDSDTGSVGLPMNPVLCIPNHLSVASLGDPSNAVIGKTTCLNNILSLFDDPSSVVVGAYGNKFSDSMAYKNSGISLNNIYTINKDSKIVNLSSEEETTYQIQYEENMSLNNRYPAIEK